MLDLNQIYFESYKILLNEKKLLIFRLNGENNCFKDFVNERFVGEIAAKYAEVSGDSLVGLDFIMDVTKGIYYLIDINPFPAYSELYNDMNQIFTEHFTMGINAKKNIINL